MRDDGLFENIDDDKTEINKGSRIYRRTRAVNVFARGTLARVNVPAGRRFPHPEEYKPSVRCAVLLSTGPKCTTRLTTNVPQLR